MTPKKASISRQDSFSYSQGTVPAPAEAGSLRRLIVDKSSDRLYTHPLRWTAQHLELLRCSVVPQDPLPHDGPNTPTAIASSVIESTVPIDVLGNLVDMRRQWKITSRNFYTRRIMRSLGTKALPRCIIGSGCVLYTPVD